MKKPWVSWGARWSLCWGSSVFQLDEKSENISLARPTLTFICLCFCQNSAQTFHNSSIQCGDSARADWQITASEENSYSNGRRKGKVILFLT